MRALLLFVPPALPLLPLPPPLTAFTIASTSAPSLSPFLLPSSSSSLSPSHFPCLPVPSNSRTRAIGVLSFFLLSLFPPLPLPDISLSTSSPVLHLLPFSPSGPCLSPLPWLPLPWSPLLAFSLPFFLLPFSLFLSLHLIFLIVQHQAVVGSKPLASSLSFSSSSSSSLSLFPSLPFPSLACWPNSEQEPRGARVLRWHDR